MHSHPIILLVVMKPRCSNNSRDADLKSRISALDIVDRVTVCRLSTLESARKVLPMIFAVTQVGVSAVSSSVKFYCVINNIGMPKILKRLAHFSKTRALRRRERKKWRILPTDFQLRNGSYGIVLCITRERAAQQPAWQLSQNRKKSTEKHFVNSAWG